jgi:hypothetical protein
MGAQKMIFSPNPLESVLVAVGRIALGAALVVGIPLLGLLIYGVGQVLVHYFGKL